MPGTIQVTVLEFKGVSSSSKPSAKSLKVSMGKTHYQTWDKGDFSFPITKLREDLIVTLLDASGNEIAHSDIQTMKIIEKGYWNEVFSINECGHVHMKLQFILNDDERNRIRIMRESAMKKKLETKANINLKLSENENKVSSDSQNGVVEIDVMRPKVESSRAGSPLNSATSSANTILESAIPVKELSANTTDGSEGAPPSSPQVHETGVVKKGSSLGSVIVIKKSPSQDPPQIHESSIRSDVNKGSLSKLPGSVISQLKAKPIEKPQSQDPPTKTPSKVRKMISAFENTQLQDVKTLKKSPSAPSHLNRYRKDGLLEGFEPKSSNDHISQATEELVSREPTVKELERETTDETRQSSSETAMSSGRMPEEQPQVVETTVAEGSGGRGTGLESSTKVNVEVVSNPKRNSLECYKEECYSAQSSGMWIYPDNTRHLCITNAGKQVMKTDEISSESKVEKQPESGYGSPPDEPSHGLVGQVIKVAVILGFGALVFLTRQKEPRKKHREQNENLLPIPSYIDERTATPWPLEQ